MFLWENTKITGKFVDILVVKKSKGNKVFSSIHWFPWTIKGDVKKREERNIAIMHMSSADKLKFYTIVSHAITNVSPYPFQSLFSSSYFLPSSTVSSSSHSSSSVKPFLVLINASAGNKQAKPIYDSVAHLFKYACIPVTTCGWFPSFFLFLFVYASPSLNSPPLPPFLPLYFTSYNGNNNNWNE